MSVWREPEEFRSLPPGRRIALRAGGRPLDRREALALSRYAQWTRWGGAVTSGLAVALGFFVVGLLMGSAVGAVAGGAAAAAVGVGLRMRVASSAAQRAERFLGQAP